MCNQILIDRDSCSDVVSYFYDVASGQIYKSWQGKLAQLLIYLPARNQLNSTYL